MRHLLDGIARYKFCTHEGNCVRLIAPNDGEYVLFSDVQARLDAGWVSVEERLPENGETVLTWSEERGYAIDHQIQCMESEPTIGGGARHVADDWRSVWDDDAPRPTHWMPLPSPPVQEKK